MGEQTTAGGGVGAGQTAAGGEAGAGGSLRGPPRRLCQPVWGASQTLMGVFQHCGASLDGRPGQLGCQQQWPYARPERRRWRLPPNRG